MPRSPDQWLDLCRNVVSHAAVVLAAKRYQHSRTTGDADRPGNCQRGTDARTAPASTRELARRFRLHPNTVSAGYKQLEKSNWLEFRKGSGVYVTETPPADQCRKVELDQLITEFFRSTRKLNTPLAVVRERLRQWLDLQPPDHFLLNRAGCAISSYRC